MKLFIGPFYAFLILGILFASFFIVFHLANYSVNRAVARTTILFFLIGITILLISNVILFFSIPIDDINSLVPSSTQTQDSSF